MALIKIIIGSTRNGRFSTQPAEFIHKLAAEQSDHTFELVDLKELNLPFLESAVPPSMAGKQYDNDKIAAWSKIVDSADGFIFITPEYNHGYPAVLKNAIDVLASEWFNKPASFVSYGVNGGVRAVEALRPTLAWLRMHDTSDFMAIQHFQYMNAEGEFNYTPSKADIEDATRIIKNIGLWADIFKDARAKLTAQA